MEAELKVEDTVRSLFRDQLGRYGFERAEIHAGQDHSGDPALFIDAYYNLSREPLETLTLLRLLTELRNRLIRAGERRFPYVRHHFNEQQQVVSRKRTAKPKA